MGLAPRLTAEAVSTTLGLESRMRPAKDSAENPAKTTECTAPILAHASCMMSAQVSQAITLPEALTGLTVLLFGALHCSSYRKGGASQCHALQIPGYLMLILRF